MICLDSDCIIDFLRGKKEAVLAVSKYKDYLSTTEINLFEVLVGINIKKIINEKEEIAANLFFDSIRILPALNFGEYASKIFAQLVKDGKMMDQNDCLIAGIMLSNGCDQIMTRNDKHFSNIKEINAINY